MTRDEAILNLQRCKMYFPYRYWCAAEINGKWETFDTKRKMTNAIKRSGQLTTNTMAIQ